MNNKVAIVGSGLIGSSWAALFVAHGYQVSLHDVSVKQLDASYELIKGNLCKLKEKNLLKKCVEECLKLITVSTTDLKEALQGAFYVQESTCESLDFKREIFKQLDELSSPTCILASSTSTIPASKFTEHLEHRDRCLVAHPVNPPLFLKLVELVPAPWTKKSAMEESKKLMQNIGQEPVSLTKEVVGFAVNRIQFAILSEAWRLVKDDVMSVEDVDKVMKAGLGPRYAFYGPFETIHLNANGIDDYIQKYTHGVRNVTADFGPNPTFNEESVVEKLREFLYEKVPLAKLKEECLIRENKLATLALVKEKSD